MDDIEEPVSMIRQQYLGNKTLKENTNKCHLQGQSERSKRWNDIDSEWLEETFCTREPDLHTKLYKINTEGHEMETHQIFVALMGNTKITE